MTLKQIRWIFLAGIAVGLDQLVKFWFSVYLPSHIQHNYLGVAGLTWFGSNKFTWLVLTGTVLLTVTLHAWKKTELSRETWWGWALIWGGGLSNWLDRLILGGVRDFWPIWGTDLKNNLADYFLTVGIVWLMINSLLEIRKKPSQIL